MAAPEFTLFVVPYLEGWGNGEEGNTPITAEILNGNYDAFLLALNEWATSVGLILEEAVTDPNYVHTDNNYTTTEKNKLSGVEDNANNYSLPTASASTLGGVKVDGITITIANGVISAVGEGGTDVEGNPSGTPTAVLSSIRIGDDIFSIPGGGGGGSSVSFTQILSTGTKIGTIAIDGVPTDIYAPTPPAKTSDLTNDSNFVSDANYVHTDNNYTTTEKNKLADLNQVEANPSSGTSAGDLTSIEIGGTKYNIPSGGSGSGGHTILNDSGTALSQENNLQFKGTYSHDDSTNGKTIVEVTRSLSKAEYEVLQPDERKGIIVITDEEVETPEITYNIVTLETGGSNASIRVIRYENGVETDRKDILYSDSEVLDETFVWYDLAISYGVLASAKWGIISLYNDIGMLGTKYSYGDEISRWSYSEDVDITLNKLLPNTEITGANYFEVEGTLAAGSTTITLSDSNITENSMIDIWTNVANLNYTDMSISNGSVTVTFHAQQSNVSVIARVWGAITGYDYSTTEHKTGRKWIDGRDIYEKTYIVIGGSTVGDHVIDSSINGIAKQLVEISGYFVNSDSKNAFVFPYVEDRMTYAFQSGTSGLCLRVKSSDWALQVTFYITVQYIKLS